ncbi:MAG: ATP-dependent DNA helicase PcrA [Candidatus Liptonbacteria bacterium]|nr:ATP-dependent DNA helicase PcrA [Candidatus Liptonbacteria bacterium]
MDFSTLNPQQQRAVKAENTPLLIVAGAGTGKTRTLTSRLMHLIEHGAPAHTICAVTFTNKAAKEMAERVHYNPKSGGFIGTFHSLGANILRKEAKELGRTSHFTIFDDHDSLSVIKKVLKELDIKGGKPPRFLQFISYIKSGAGKETLSLRHREEQRVFERYEMALTRNNAFDFDDLIAKVVWLFENRPAILAKYQEKYQYILVDEYQDVSPAQYTLIRLLSGPNKNVSVVGDDAQMIYGWRYANIETFLQFERDWPNAQVVLLEENYRSSGTIVHAASAVIANNIVAREKNLWTRNPDGEVITITETLNEEDEAEWIAAQILEGKLSKGNRQGSTAILYRTNAQSRAIEQALLKKNIAYRIYGGLKFYDRREIKDIVAALRLTMNPKDEMSRERLEKAFRVRVWKALLPVLEEALGKPPREVIENFLSTTEYFDYLERETMNPEERRENINELLRFAESFSDLGTFLEHIALVQSTDDVNAELKAKSLTLNAMPVHLSTIHLAKGLEFDQVFLAGCAEGMLPHNRSMESENEIEEERRLMYVGMTRARHELAISFSGIPSRFIGEIPPNLAEFLRTETATDPSYSDSYSDDLEIQLD